MYRTGDIERKQVGESPQRAVAWPTRESGMGSILVGLEIVIRLVRSARPGWGADCLHGVEKDYSM